MLLDPPDELLDRYRIWGREYLSKSAFVAVGFSPSGQTFTKPSMSACSGFPTRRASQSLLPPSIQSMDVRVEYTDTPATAGLSRDGSSIGLEITRERSGLKMAG